MQTTVTDYKPRTCGKCGGSGTLSSYQHHKGGVCFRCAGTGNDPQMIAVEREMTNAEVISALETAGFPIMRTMSAPTGDEVLDLLFPLEEITPDAMTGARMMLAAI